MTQYVLGIMSALIVVSAADALSADLPNDLWYYIDTHLPF